MAANAQRGGYFAALKVGFGGMAIVLGAGTFLPGLITETIVMVLWTGAVCFTWAPLEALASHGEDRPGLARMIGLYNVVWSAGAAVAYFTAGALQQALGWHSLYWMPASVHVMQFALLFCLEHRSRLAAPSLARSPAVSPETGEPPDFAQHHINPETAKASAPGVAGQSICLCGDEYGGPADSGFGGEAWARQSWLVSRRPSGCSPGWLRSRCFGAGPPGITGSAGCWRRT
jgi:hypothetical protein